ncbi:MAG: GatB/YqeY domain-containing protein [Chloroflexota bacterium]|nr:GatB/YqeY domain-containing protein [Chloroflexota bacterium]
MTLESKVRGDLRQALKQRDSARVSTLRLVLSEAKNAEIARHRALDDGEFLAVVSKQAKQRRESIALFKKGNRLDLVTREEKELDILGQYLPQQMSHEEIMRVVRETVDAVEAKGMKDKGRVMSRLMPQLRGKADGKEVSDIVLELLSGS